MRDLFPWIFLNDIRKLPRNFYEVIFIGKEANSFSFDFIDLIIFPSISTKEVNKQEIEYIDRACIFAQYLFALIGRYVKQRETVSSNFHRVKSRANRLFFFLFSRTIIPDGYDRARFTAPCPFSIENGTNFLLDAFNGQNAFRTLRFIRTFSLFFVFFFHTPTFHGFGYSTQGYLLFHHGYFKYFRLH